MEGMGQITARRAGSSGVIEVPRNASPVFLEMPPSPSTSKSPTTEGTNAVTPRKAGLLRESESVLKAGNSAFEGIPGAAPAEVGSTTPAQEPTAQSATVPLPAAEGSTTPAQDPKAQSAAVPLPAALHEPSAEAPEATAVERSHLPAIPAGSARSAGPECSSGFSSYGSEAGRAVPGLLDGSLLDGALLDGIAAVDALRSMAFDEVRLLGFVGAADFAGRIEEIARCVEYLQVVAAQAVERARTEAQQVQQARSGRSSSPSASASGAGAGAAAAVTGWQTGWSESAADPEIPAPAGFPNQPGVLDDGYRNAAEFLRARLRIGIGEARRRLALAPDVLPQIGMTGQQIPARREILADAVGSALLPSRSATIISTALDKVRHLTDDETLTRMEHALTTTATETDPDFLTKMTKRWIDHIDHDGPEPSEETLRQHQGAFLRRRRRYGLHHIEIFATDEQYETLTTTMNTATNPRLHNTTDTTPATATATTAATADEGTATAGPGTKATEHQTTGPDLDRRSRAQKLLDGLVGACGVAMSTGQLPSNGGLRPQLTVTIDHRDLLNQLTTPTTTSRTGAGPGKPSRTGTGTEAGVGSAMATFTGPIHPATIRKIACDADIIPVLLGSDSRVLDIGRTTRIFPPHIRKAITAR
ncbi:DUF222 domain-containing protein, partial [Paenarthrobacter aurescens]